MKNDRFLDLIAQGCQNGEDQSQNLKKKVKNVAEPIINMEKRVSIPI